MDSADGNDRLAAARLKLASLVYEGRGVRGEGRGKVVAGATVDLIGRYEEQSNHDVPSSDDPDAGGTPLV